MADEVEDEEPKKGGLIKIIIMVVAAILLIAVGLGIGYFIFGGEPEPDPSAEVNQIIEGKNTKEKETSGENDTKEGEVEGEDGVLQKNVKSIPEVNSYETTYFEFPGDFTTNLKDSRKFLQLSVGVSTQYDEKVMEVVDSHQLALRSEILSTVSDFTEEDISGSDGKKKLSERLMVVLNAKLEKLKEFPGIEDVYFTAFILQ